MWLALNFGWHSQMIHKLFRRKAAADYQEWAATTRGAPASSPMTAAETTI